MRPSQRLALALPLLLAAGGLRAQTCTTTWTNTAGGAWATATNWSAGVPTAASVACVTTPGTYTVTSGGVTARTLRLGGASGVQTLQLSGEIAPADSAIVAATGVVVWTSDYLMSGRLVNRGLIRLTGPNNSRGVRGGAVLRNEGRIEWADAGNFFLGEGGRVENAAALAVTGTGNFTVFSPAGTFVNLASGTVSKTGAGTFTLNAPTDNSGTISVGAGSTVTVTSASTHRSPTFAVAQGGTLAFSGTLALVGTVSGTPAGRLVVSNEIEATDAALALGGTGFEWTSNYLVSGRLVNRGLIRLTGANNSRGVRGSTGSGAVLRNEGRVEWSETGNFFLGEGGRVENASTITVTGAGSFTVFSAGTFANEAGATLAKTGVGTFTLNAPTDNAGTLSVGTGGTMSVTSASMHRSPTFIVEATATLSFTGTLALSGTVTSAPLGRIVVSNTVAAPDGATLNVTGTGLEWTGNYLTAGRLVNRGLVRLTGTTASRGVRGTGVVFRNEGQVEWPETGQFFVYDGARFENAAALTVTGGGSLRGFTGTGTFANEATATFVRSGEGTFTLGTDLPVTGRVPLTVLLEGAVRLEGAVHAAGAAITNRAAFSVGATPGAAATLTWTGDFPLNAGANLRLDLLAAGAFDRLVVVAATRPVRRGEAVLNGTLTVALGAGFVPAAGAAFEVVRAVAIAGGLQDLTSLTVESAGVTLYPSVVGGAYVLTAAAGIPTVSGSLAAAPPEATNGRITTVALAGTGFAPDLAVALECRGCGTPGTFGTIPGRFVGMTATAFEATFDLTPVGISGPYEIVVRDPRGGIVRTAFRVNEGPPVISIAVLDGQASEAGRRPGLFVVRSTRPVREPVAVPFTLSGTARLFTDYMTDVLGRTFTLAAGRDSLVVAIFPLNDALTEAAETVTVQITPPGPTGVRTATLSIADGPPETAFAVYTTSPRAGGNVGTTTLTVGGQGFTSASTVSLTGGGGPLVAPSVTVNAAGTFLVATFDLTGQTLGPRTVVVRSGAGEDVAFPRAFTVEAAIYPEVFVQVLAPARVPRTRERTYTVVLTNRGNVGVVGYPSLYGFPEGTAWNTDVDARPRGGAAIPWHEFTPAFVTEGRLVITLPPISLGAGETREVKIRAAITTPQTFSLIADWVYLR